MKVLIACEESQEVCKAFRAAGHEAYSCDIEEPSGDHPEWHILGDVKPILNAGIIMTMDGERHTVDKWDLLIAHPPCTYITTAGARYMYKNGKINSERLQKAMEARRFFMLFMNSDIQKVAIENPTPMKIVGLPPYTQAVQPYEHGHPYSKRTCLWLKGLPKLKPTDLVKDWQSTRSAEWYNCGGKERKKNRSKTFTGIAVAMASQWGNCSREKILTNLGIYDKMVIARTSNIERSNIMKVVIKKYVAKVSRFVEHEDGTITKETAEIVLNGKRFSEEIAERAIPRDCRLICSGWVETAFEVDAEKLEKFCRENGKEM